MGPRSRFENSTPGAGDAVEAFAPSIINSVVGEVRPKEDGSGPRNHLGNGTPGAGDAVEAEVKPLICLPFKGKEGDKVIAQFRNALTKALTLGSNPVSHTRGGR